MMRHESRRAEMAGQKKPDPKAVEEIAQKAWGAAQRLGMKIAAMPLHEREAGYAICEKSLRETARKMGIAGEQMEGFIKIQLEAIRGMVQKIDVGGNPQGGKA
jgi:hypothetical protein